MADTKEKLIDVIDESSSYQPGDRVWVVGELSMGVAFGDASYTEIRTRTAMEKSPSWSRAHDWKSCKRVTDRSSLYDGCKDLNKYLQLTTKN